MQTDRTDTPHRSERLLRRSEAAEYVENKRGMPCKKTTLAKLAVIGGGPTFRRAGRVPLYSPDDLDSWVDGKLGPKVRSTSELEAARA